MTTFAIGNTTTTALSINTDTTGNVVITATGGVVNTGSLTGAIVIPAGTDAQRPGSPANGTFRYNTTNAAFEGYAAGAWGAIGGGGGGGATDEIFYGNSNTIASNFTSTSGYNYSSAGPLIMSANLTVTIGTGSQWMVL